MKKQGYNDRLDESLGMRRGKESGKMQSYKDRRDESRGARRHESKKSSHPMKRGSSLFGVEDNKKSGKVYYVSTDGEPMVNK